MDILIDTSTVRNNAEQLKTYMRNLSDKRERLESIQKQLDYEVKYKRNIVDSINSLQIRILKVEERIEKIQYLLLFAATNYESAEKTVVKLLKVLDDNLIGIGIEGCSNDGSGKSNKETKKVIPLIRGAEIVIDTTVVERVVGATYGLVRGIISEVKDSNLIDSFVDGLLGVSSSKSLFSKKDKVKTKVGNVTLGCKTSEDVLGYKAGISTSVSGKLSDGSVGVATKGEASAYLAKEKVEFNAGIASTSSEVTVGNVGASGEVRAGLVKDGEFAPEATVKIGARAQGITRNVENKVGNDTYDVHTGAKGTVGSAEAEAGCAIGVNGVGAKAKAGAAVFKGEVKSGFTLFGIKIDLSIEGEAIGVGAKAEAGIMKSTNSSGEETTTLNIGGKITAFVGAGLNLKISW